MLRFCKDLSQKSSTRRITILVVGILRLLEAIVENSPDGKLAPNFFQERRVAFLESLLLDFLLDLLLGVQEARAREFLPLHNADDMEAVLRFQDLAEPAYGQAEDRL